MKEWLIALVPLASAYLALSLNSSRRRGQQPLNLPHHPIHFFLIRQRDHEELIALMKTDDAVGEQPHTVEEGIAAEQPTYRRAGDSGRTGNLCDHHCAGGATECAQQRRADVLRHLPLKFNSLSLRFV